MERGTKDEWSYLFENHTYGLAKITIDAKEYYGMVVVPDDWTGASVTSGITSWTLNEYDATSWAAMEENGALFLPATYGRTGSTITRHYSDPYLIGN